MTGFRKVDLPHISNLPTLTTHNFRLENGVDLILILNLNTKLWFLNWMHLQTHFCKSGHL